MPITVAVNSPPRGAPPSSDSAIVGHKTIGLILTQVLQSLCGEGGKGFSIVVMSRKPSPTEVQVLFRQITSVEKKKMWIWMLVSVGILDTDIRAGKQKLNKHRLNNCEAVLEKTPMTQPDILSGYVCSEVSSTKTLSQ